MRMYDLIVKKRNGDALKTEEIKWIIDNYCKDNVPDYQMSALLMAIYYQGMSDRELSDLTMAMVNSGDQIDLSGVEGVIVDKHSTGGVGDKTTFIVAPIVAACGGKIAKMSGRGLGHTGGTIDKMEAIPNLKSTLPKEDFIKQVNEVGVSVIGQSGELAPADKKIYALRDVTGTVDSIPLIASSIMSKKLASGSDGIVLDVKVGSGAFMKTIDSAIELAQKMVAIGVNNGKQVVALVTNMDVPLGAEIGNANEMHEVIDVLSGQGPEDVREEAIALAGNMIMMTNDKTIDECCEMAKEVIENGKALEVFYNLVKAQGGNIENLKDELAKRAKYAYEVKAIKSGYINHMETEKCGVAAVVLGAGRAVKSDELNFKAGITVHKKTGDCVKTNDVIATLYSDDEVKLEQAAKIYQEAVMISDDKPVVKPCIFARVTSDSVEKYYEENRQVNLEEYKIQELIEAARRAMKNAYAPYSKFSVGAAVLTSEGKVYTGTNVENVAYGDTICAERVAITKAISEGINKFDAIVIISDLEDYCSPCGSCRQVISEFNIQEVIMAKSNGEYEQMSLNSLLPRRFKKIKK